MFDFLFCFDSLKLVETNEPEIGYFDIFVIANENITGGQIAVHDLIGCQKYLQSKLMRQSVWRKTVLEMTELTIPSAICLANRSRSLPLMFVPLSNSQFDRSADKWSGISLIDSSMHASLMYEQFPLVAPTMPYDWFSTNNSFGKECWTIRSAFGLPSDFSSDTLPVMFQYKWLLDCARIGLQLTLAHDRTLPRTPYAAVLHPSSSP